MASRTTTARQPGRATGWLLAVVALLALACGDPVSVVTPTPNAHTPGATPPEVIVGEQLTTDHFNGVQAYGAQSGQSRWRASIDASLAAPTWLFEANGVIYAGALDHVYAFADDDGTQLWHTHLPFNADDVHASADGTLYGISFNPCDVSASGACVYSLDPRSGKLRWTYEADPLNHLLTPQVAGDVVYTAGEDDMVYALRADSGALLWRRQPSGSAHDTAPSLTLAGNVVYLGSGDGRLYALDASTGATRWSFQSPATNPYPQIPSVPRATVADTIAYVATGRDALTALDATSGTVRWTHATQGAVLEAPVLVGETLYATTAGDGAYALDPTTGAVRWHALAGAVLSGPPTLAGGMLYGVTFDHGIIHALDASTGVVHWQAQASVPSALLHAVHLFGVEDGTVYAEDTSNVPSVTAWDAATGSARWQLRPSEGVGSTLPAILVG